MNKFERTRFGDGVTNTVSNVSNIFGPRTPGGVKGVIKTEGVQNEATIDFDGGGPLYDLKVIPAGSIVTDIQGYGLVGAIATALVGAQNIAAAKDDSKATWVVITANGALEITGPTGGKVVVKYRHVAQD